MADKNRYGLSRHIPSAITLELRQKYGFGCIICGDGIITYEHVEPTFSEAREHNPEHMTLLCGTHQQMSTAGSLSKDTIFYYMNNPKCLEDGFSLNRFDLGRTHPQIILGTLEFNKTQDILTVSGEPILTIKKSEQKHSPFLLSAKFHSQDGTEIFVVENNVWKNPTTNWDAEMKRREVKIRRKSRDIQLLIEVQPPHTLLVKTLKAYYKGIEISCSNGKPFSVRLPDGRYVEVTDSQMSRCTKALDISHSGINLEGCQEARFSKLSLSSIRR